MDSSGMSIPRKSKKEEEAIEAAMEELLNSGVRKLKTTLYIETWQTASFKIATRIKKYPEGLTKPTKLHAMSLHEMKNAFQSKANNMGTLPLSVTLVSNARGWFNFLTARRRRT